MILLTAIAGPWHSPQRHASTSHYNSLDSPAACGRVPLLGHDGACLLSGFIGGLPVAWSKLEDTFRDDRKFKRLAKRLRIRPAEARGLVAGLWSWCTRQEPDGDLSNYEISEIAEAADWYGRPERFFDAVVAERLLDSGEDSDGVPWIRVHNFLRRAGAYKKAKQQQERRTAAKEATRGASESPRGPHAGASVALRRTEKRREEKNRDGSSWMLGEPITTGRDLEGCVSHLHLAAGVLPKELPKLARIVAGGPIEAHEVEHAHAVTTKKAPKQPVAYFLGVIESTRQTAADEAAKGPAAGPTPKPSPGRGWAPHQPED